AAEELEQVKAEDGSGEVDDAELQQRYEQAVAANDAADARVNELVDAERGAERDIASEQARLDALYMGLSRKDGAGALLEASEQVPGVLGSVSALLRVEAGYEASVAAALGPVADAVALAAGQDPRDALNYLKSQEAGRAGMLLGQRDADATAHDDETLPTLPTLPTGAVWARSLVTPPDGLRAAVDRALTGTVVVDDLDVAARVVDDLAETVPGVVAVTGDGEVLGAHWAFGGSERGES